MTCSRTKDEFNVKTEREKERDMRMNRIAHNLYFMLLQLDMESQGNKSTFDMK